MSLIKLLCLIGIHKSEVLPLEFVRDEDKKSLVKITKICTRCGKEKSEYVWFPKL